MISQKILLIRLSSLGDVVLTTPAIRAVRAHFSDAYIAMLVGKQSADVLRENPHLDEIITFDRLAKNKDTREMLRTVRVLRERKFTLAIDLQRKFRTELLMYFSGAADRVGKGVLCTVRVLEQGNKHATAHYFDLLHAVGIPAVDQKLELFLAESERTDASQRFDAAGVTQTGLKVGVFPGAGWKLREWMPDRFATIGDRLVRHFNTEILIFGGQKEAELVHTVANLMDARAVPFAGNLQVRELAACIEKCDLFLTNDTGPMHIAAAVGTPTVSLFGPGNHIRFQPLGGLHQTLRHDVPCSPCKQFTDKCKDNICMKKITVDEVWQSISETLTSSARRLKNT
ncbi:glycosyltransferase family 9 protein [Candidatus Poribacteria bacterium]|nr:glycosyltransferase family 9 protein [Candidatus Poribacteria bacterium]